MLKRGATCAEHQQLGTLLHWPLQPGHLVGGSAAHGRPNWAAPPHHAACCWWLTCSIDQVQIAFLPAMLLAACTIWKTVAASFDSVVIKLDALTSAQLCSLLLTASAI